MNPSNLATSHRPIKRLGVIGDVHCEDQRLEIALSELASRRCCQLAQLGDIADGDGDLDRCVALLDEASVLVVRGNHDRWFLAGERRDRQGATQDASAVTRSYLRNLPPTARLTTVRGDILLGHGVGADDMAVFEPTTRGFALQAMLGELAPMIEDEELAYFIGGHTHIRMARRYATLWMLNAGTLHDSGPPGFVIVDFEAEQMECFDLVGDEVVPKDPIRLQAESA